MDKFRQDWVSWNILVANTKLQLLSISAPTAPNDPIAYISWPRVYGKQQYFELGSTVQAGEMPHGERMHFWNEMKAKLD